MESEDPTINIHRPTPKLRAGGLLFSLRSWLLAVVCMASVAQATVLTFDTGQDNNNDLSTTFGSNISGDIPGATVSNGGTPSIALTWAPSPNALEVHGAATFDPIDPSNSGAANSLGDIYLHGWDVDIDKKEALHWYRLAANSRDPEASFMMGEITCGQYAEEADCDEGFLWYQAAANGGHSQSGGASRHGDFG